MVRSLPFVIASYLDYIDTESKVLSMPMDIAPVETSLAIKSSRSSHPNNKFSNMSNEGRYSNPDPEILSPTPRAPDTKARETPADQGRKEVESLTSKVIVCSQHENYDLEYSNCHHDLANTPQAVHNRQIDDSKLQHLATIATLPGPKIFQEQVVFPEAILMRAHLSMCAEKGTPHNLRTTFVPTSSNDSVSPEAISYNHTIIPLI
ncbi:hypothetical protein BGZ60DRAFT_69271 [Tricladium varicosporioides]|nr:hypothetical protein BGZ60DRAFT_69271 [Hymenoscyphus varicosporioides]